MTQEYTPMSESQMELIAELAAARAIEKHESANIGRLRFFETDLRAEITAAKVDCKQYTDNSINYHESKCPVGLEFRACRAKLIGIAIGLSIGSSGLTVALTKLLGI